MQILTSESIRAKSGLEILLAWLGFVFHVTEALVSQLLFSMSKATSITKLALTSKFPILAKFSFELSFVILNKLSSFFSGSKFLSFRADIYLEVRLI